MKRQRRNRMLWGLAGIVALLLLFLGATPVWFPWLFRPMAERFGLTYKNYDRLGYSRFAANEIVFSNKNVIVKADHIETLVPTAWLWRHWFEGQPTKAVIVNGWTVTTRPSSGPRRGPSSTYTNFQRIDKILVALQRWLPAAAATNGLIQFRGVSLQVPHANWQDGAVSGAIVDPARNIKAAVQANVGPTGITAITAASHRLDLISQILIADSAGGLSLEGEIQWLTNKIELDAHFPTKGRLPQEAQVTASAFSIPADRLHLKGYDNLRGNFSAHWKESGFRVEASALAHPQTNTGVPPVKIDLHGVGDANGARIETVHIESPLLTAELSQPVTVRYGPPFLDESVTLKASLDLGEQRWFPATGQVSARALVFPSNARYPAADFELSGEGIQASNVSIQTVAVSGEFRWPLLIVPSVTVHTFDSIAVQAAAEVNIAERTVADASLEVTAKTEPTFLPDGMTASNVLLSANFRGPFSDVIHSGQLKADSFHTSITGPLRLSAKWQGQHLAITNILVQANAADEAAVTARLSVDVAAPRRSIHLKEFLLATEGNENLKLVAPATVTISQSTQTNRTPSIAVSSLRLAGAAEIAVQGVVEWPASGRFTNAVRGLDAEMLAPFLRTRPLPVRIDHLSIGAAWSNGPVALTIDAAAQGFITNAGGGVVVSARAAANESGITLQHLSLASDVAPGLTGEGFLPMTIDPRHGINLREDETLNVRFSSFPDAVVWDALAERFGIALESPNVTALLGGSWKEPRGQIDATIEQIRVLRVNRPLPIFADVAVTVEVTREQLALTRGQVEVERRPIELTGKMPLGEPFWDSIVERKMDFDWQKVSAHLVVPQTELQPFAEFLPELIAPQGRLHADLRLNDGKVNGVLRLQDLRTRPIPSLGPIRDLDVRARFEGNRINIHPIDATLGGRQVRGEGAIHLPPDLIPREGLPPFHFRIWGANVPLVRQPDAIIRADLELEMTNSPSLKAPLIEGGLVMRKSFFLSDLEDLVPGKVAGPKRRPPYFSITNDLLKDWRLQIDVRGNEFIKIRGPLFRGAASVTMRIEGTLAEPVALGEVRIDSGRILFPFANFEVQQGFVTLSSADPYRPSLNVMASTRRVGYEIKVEVTGAADAPIVQFSSSPPLSPEQIVLMVTAGQMPTETARLTTEQRAQRMAVFLGGNLLREFGIGGGDEERLSVRSGEQLTEAGSQTYEAEYKLTDDLSLVGEYDRFNEFNVGLKWRIYSK